MRFDLGQKPDLLPEGEHEFEVMAANESTSANGNAMLVLRLKFGLNGSSKYVTDYVVNTNIRKIKSVAKACGLGDLIETGEILPENFIGRRGKARLVVEKSSHPDYPDRNVVASYLARR